MPLYEFACKDCGHKFEELVFGGKSPRCPQCGSAYTDKLLSVNSRRLRPSAGGSDAAPASGGGCSGCSGGNCSGCRG